MEQGMKKMIIMLSFALLILSGSISAMDTARAKQIVLQKHEFIPPLSKTIDQDQLNDLIKQASAGDGKAAYIIGCHYLHGISPTNNLDLNQAEQWILEAKNKGYLPAYRALCDIASYNNEFEKAIAYSKEAIQQGFLDANYVAGKAYSKLGKDDEARRLFVQVLDDLKNQTAPYLIQMREEAAFELCSSLSPDITQNKKYKRIMSTIMQLANENPSIKIKLAINNLPQNTKFATKLLEEIMQNEQYKHHHSHQKFYFQASTLLGLIFEKGDRHNPPNIEKAKQYFMESADGYLHLARLRLMGKIKDCLISFENNENLTMILTPVAAKKMFEKVACYSIDPDPALSILAGYLYGTILLSEGKAEEGLNFLLKAAEKVKQRHAHGSLTLVSLQLGIAYHYGFGVEKNEKKANEYFAEIIKTTRNNRPVLLALGYMNIFGLGGIKKDIAKGLDFISQAETKFNSTFFSTEELFPIVIKLRQEQAIQEFLEQEEQEGTQSKKKKTQKTPKKTNQLTTNTADDQNPFKITTKEWNDYFKVNDGSYISCIDPEHLSFTITDPKRNEELIVQAEKLPDREFVDIEALQFHKRILERQGKYQLRLNHNLLVTLPSSIPLNAKIKHDHDFAEMLDYVIQYIGEWVPFMKNGNQNKDDQLIATVIRKNMATQEEVACRAEYTFGQKDNDLYVYHRLLRPACSKE